MSLRLKPVIPILIATLTGTACGGSPERVNSESVAESVVSDTLELRRDDLNPTLEAGSDEQRATVPDPTAPIYDFTQPDRVFELENDLEEISGLTVFDDRHLATIEDEHGRFYLIDYETGEITAERKFAGKGDYEAIERAGDRLFVLRSDAQIRELTDFEGDEPGDHKFDLDLNSQCDSEGLAYQSSQNRLLVSCKEHPAKGLRGMRAIYAVDLGSMEMIEAPVYLIRTDTIHAAVGAPSSALRDFLSPIADLDGFKPSALAVNPLTDELFVLSSVLKVIVVLDVEGSVMDVIALDDRLLRQPEGLAFLENGDLFISSEGAGGKPRLVRFNNRNR